MKTEIRIIETLKGKKCKHTSLVCQECGSFIFTHDIKPFNVKRFKRLAQAILDAEEKENEKTKR
jgi:hypothetical protein